MLIFYILPIFFFLLLVLGYLHLIKYKDIWKLPGPSLFSTMRSTFTGQKSTLDVFTTVSTLNQIYGPTVKIWTSPLKPMLVVTNLKYIEFFLTSTIHLDKSDLYDFFEPFTGTGLATSEGSKWKAQRKQLNPAFNNKLLANYVDTFSKYSSELIATLDDKATADFIDVLPIMLSYTLKVICATILNLRNMLDTKEKYDYLKAREGFYTIVMERSLSMLKRNKFLFWLTSAYGKQMKQVKIINEFSSNIINHYRRQTGYNKFNNEASTKHAIDLLLHNYDSDDKELIEQISTLIVAGHDTSATGASFALYELSKHPEIQEKLLEESNFVMGQDRDVELTMAHIQQMKYLDCVMKETLRLYPLVPVFERKAKEDVVIDGTFIPKGTDVGICMYGVHINEDYHPSPKKFDPDRFLPENIGKMKPFSFLPFSLGPRNCIGKPFAMLEMKSIVTILLRRFRLQPADGQPEMKFSSQFVLKSTIGMPIRLKRRDAKFI